MFRARVTCDGSGSAAGAFRVVSLRGARGPSLSWGDVEGAGAFGGVDRLPFDAAVGLVHCGVTRYVSPAGRSLDAPAGDLGSFRFLPQAHCFVRFGRFTFWCKSIRAPGASSASLSLNSFHIIGHFSRSAE